MFKLYTTSLLCFTLSIITALAQTASLPYFSNFDTLTTNWTAIPSTLGNTNWELGSPSFGTTNSSLSNPNAWDLNLNTAYEANAECFLKSPFIDFSGNPFTTLRFWQNRNVQNNWDGTRLEYSLDSGITWQVLGSVGAVNSVNWYNNPSLIASGLPGWTGQSGGQIGSSIWQMSEIELPDFSTNTIPVQFQFVFNSNSAVQFDGMSIDNFEIEVNSNFTIDVGLTNIIFNNSVPAGDTIPLLVQFANFSNIALDSFYICYSINGGTPNCISYVITLNPGDTSQNLWIGFIVVPSGASNLCVWISIANDSNPNNDLICNPLLGESVIELSFGNDFCDGFDSINNGWTKEPFNNQWELGVPADPIINNAHSAPNVWTIKLTGNYNNNSNDNLYSPPFDFSNAVNAKLSFYNWMHSEANWDGGRIDYSTDNGITWSVLGSVGDPKGINWYTLTALVSTGLPGWQGQSTGWIKSEYLLDQFDNHPTTVKFRFNFSSDQAVNSFNGWAIDDFKIELPVPINAQTNSISAGGPIINPGAVPIFATVTNAGASDLTVVDVTLEIDGNIIVTDTRNFNPPLTTNTSIVHTFSIPWNAITGCSDIKVWTSNPNASTDLILSDDTTQNQFCVFETISTLPYCDDFENGSTWTAYNSNDNSTNHSWELGKPNQTTINNAFSGNNAWMTKLNQDYPNLDVSVLLTPGFDVQSQTCYKFSFMGNFETEFLLDGGSIDFSYDGGLTWTTLGDTSNVNWYNTYNIISFGTIFPKAGWSGTSNGWNKYEKLHTAQQTGKIIFRFWFISDLTITNDGWAIDDFCFEELPPGCITSSNELDYFMTAPIIYPNPAAINTNIQFNLSESLDLKVEIFNSLGELVSFIPEKRYRAGGNRILINSSKLISGIYFIKLSSGNKYTSKKLMIAY